MATLESLPTEIVEMIFRESLNISLPRASSPLGVALSSTDLKIDIVHTAFATKDKYELASFEEIKSKLSGGERGDHETQIQVGILQSNILKCRWMTWEFLVICMEKFITATIINVFEAFELPWHNLKPVTIPEVQMYVHDVFHQNETPGIGSFNDEDLDRSEPSSQEEWDDYSITQAEQSNIFDIAANDSRNHQDRVEGSPIVDVDKRTETDGESDKVVGPDRIRTIFTLDTGISNTGNPEPYSTSIPRRLLAMQSWKVDGEHGVALGIPPRTGVVAIGSNFPHLEPKASDGYWSHTVICPFCPDYTGFVPDKLLKGPWSDEKVNFLKVLLEGYARIPGEHQQSLADDGLMDAIAEDSFRAVDLLVSESIDARHMDTRRGMEGVHVDPSMRYMTLGFKNGEGFVEGTHFRRRRTAGLAPNTEHLKAAFLKRGCWKAIVRRLLFAKKQDIDRDDSAIVAWIKEKTCKGNPKGEWLQFQLNRSARLLRLRKKDIKQALYADEDDAWDSDWAALNDFGSNLDYPDGYYAGDSEDSSDDGDENDEEDESVEGDEDNDSN